MAGFLDFISALAQGVSSYGSTVEAIKRRAWEQALEEAKLRLLQQEADVRNKLADWQIESGQKSLELQAKDTGLREKQLALSEMEMQNKQQASEYEKLWNRLNIISKLDPNVSAKAQEIAVTQHGTNLTELDDKRLIEVVNEAQSRIASESAKIASDILGTGQSEQKTPFLSWLQSMPAPMQNAIKQVTFLTELGKNQISGMSPAAQQPFAWTYANIASLPYQQLFKGGPELFTTKEVPYWLGQAYGASQGKITPGTWTQAQTEQINSTAVKNFANAEYNRVRAALAPLETKAKLIAANARMMSALRSGQRGAEKPEKPEGPEGPSASVLQGLMSNVNTYEKSLQKLSAEQMKDIAELKGLEAYMQRTEAGKGPPQYIIDRVRTLASQIEARRPLIEDTSTKLNTTLNALQSVMSAYGQTRNIRVPAYETKTAQTVMKTSEVTVPITIPGKQIDEFINVLKKDANRLGWKKPSFSTLNWLKNQQFTSTNEALAAVLNKAVEAKKKGSSDVITKGPVLAATLRAIYAAGNPTASKSKIDSVVKDLMNKFYWRKDSSKKK